MTTGRTGGGEAGGGAVFIAFTFSADVLTANRCGSAQIVTYFLLFFSLSLFYILCFFSLIVFHPFFILASVFFSVSFCLSFLFLSLTLVTCFRV